MKNYITIVILIISNTLFSQNKDLRAELEIKGRISEISVSPDEHISLPPKIKNNSNNKHYKKPLKKFLKHPIQSLSLVSNRLKNCYGLNTQKYYYLINGPTLKLDYPPDYKGDRSKPIFKKEISSALLLGILKQINKSPSTVPAISEFNISEEDKKNYLSLVEERLKSVKHLLYRKKKVSAEFYYSMPKKLDTLSKTTIEGALNQKYGVWGTYSYQHIIQIINQNNDTLYISNNSYYGASPWSLPWKVEFENQYFNCYNINLTRFINNCVFKSFTGKDFFDNKYLIMKIAEYLYVEEEE